MSTENDCTIIKTFDGKAEADAEKGLPLKFDDKTECGHTLLRHAYEEVGPKTVSIFTALPGGKLEAGTGFFVGKDGDEVITNAHVINGARRNKIETSTGETFGAKIIDIDEINDLALLKIVGISKDPTRDLVLGDDRTVKSGTPILSVGHPALSQHAVATDGEAITRGSYFALHDQVYAADLATAVEQYRSRHPEFSKEVVAYFSAEKIKADTPVWHGNSGGPMVDDKNRVLGVAEAIDPTTPSISYAVPVSKVADLLNRPHPQFDFHYKFESQFDRHPLATVAETVALPALGYVGRRFFAPLSGVADGFDAYDQLSLAFNKDAYGSRVKYFAKGAEDLAGVAAGVMSLIPRTRAIGCGIFVGKLAIDCIGTYLPDRPIMQDVKRTNGDQRLPFDWQSIGI